MPNPVSIIETFSPDTILQSLLGAWTIERRVDDAATLTGNATFERSREGEAVYHEQGTLRLSTGYEAAAERKYLYRQSPDGFAVFFAEHPPRLFHEVTLAREADGRLFGVAEHACADDLYRTEYQFEPGANFVICHRVRGPRKAYTMTTVYRRMADTDR